MVRLLFVGPQSDVRLVRPPPADEEHDEITVVFVGSADEVLARAGGYDLLIVSAALPNDDALQIVRAVAAAEPAVRILVKDLVESHQAPLPYIKAGATGWLL